MTQNRKAARLAEEIDANLRRVYGEATEDAVPDRFTNLLEQLKAADKNKAQDPHSVSEDRHEQ